MHLITILILLLLASPALAGNRYHDPLEPSNRPSDLQRCGPAGCLILDEVIQPEYLLDDEAIGPLGETIRGRQEIYREREYDVPSVRQDRIEHSEPSTPYGPSIR